MYRVLIVDDGPVIRNGIRAFIDWEKEGMIAEDDCANGMEALEVMKRRPFDILITDIKMPIMNGIQLMKEARTLYPWLKVILISSYNDFEFVREGLKLGAVDYLLKSDLEPEELLAVLRLCISMLEEEQKKEREQNDQLQGALYRERKSLEQEIKRLIVQEQTSPSAVSWAPAWMDKPYACVYLMLDGTEDWKETSGDLYVQLLLEEVQELFYIRLDEGAAMLAGDNGLFLIFPDQAGEGEGWLRQWKQLAERERQISMSGGFVSMQGAGSLQEGFICSRSACQRRFFEGLGGLYRYEEQNDTRSGLASNNKTEHDWTPFFEMIRNGDPLSSAVEYAVERWRSGLLTPQQIQEEACRLLTETYELHGDADNLLPEQLDQLCRTETLEQLVSLLITQPDEIGKPVMPKLADAGYGGQLISKALDFMTEHYRENLTLQSVADTVHLSKSYFSLLFKKQTGRNFIDYLVELRVREAKRLLAHTEGRIYDVARGSGFKDVKYFCKVFKKVSGFTPMEYRDKHQKASSPAE